MRPVKVTAIILVLIMVLGVLGGCSSPASSGSSTAPTAPPSSGGSSGGSSDEMHELYKMLPDTCLSGVMNPDTLEDRSNINKALPFEPKDKTNVVIGWTEITQSDPWFVSVYDSAKARAAEYGYTLYFDVADGDLQKQSAHIDSYIARDVDIIVVDPTDVVGIAEDIQRAVEAGIPVIGFGSEIYGAPVITTITANTFEDGYATGKYTATQFGADEQINLGVIIGTMGNSTAESRVNGMLSGIIYQRAQMQNKALSREDAILAATLLFKDLVKTGKFNSSEWKIECLSWGEGLWTYEGGLEVAENILTAAQDKLNLILAENDFQGAGAAKALKNYGLQDKIKIASPGNGMKNEVMMVKNGELLCTGPHNGWAFAEATIDMVHDLANGTNTYDENNLPMLTAFEAFAITKETFDTYWDDDAANLYHKTPALKIRTVPELIQALKDGTYYAK